MTPSKQSLPRALALALASLLPFAAFAQAPDPTPRLGLLIPVGPPDYAILLDAFKPTHDETDGPFTFRAGTVSGVPVVYYIAPTDGPLVRSLGAQAMLQHFNIKAFIYAGTSGGHLPPDQMSIGDIVLGAKNVDHGNYFLNRAGVVEPGSFNSIQKSMRHYGALYADPKLLSFLACSATRVAAHTETPSYLSPIDPAHHPQVFFYGIQGTSTIWSDNLAYTKQTMNVFHEIDEDGDWYSNLVATLYHVPFIEVSIISNSILGFPNADRGTPKSPAGEPNTHVLAQRLSNRIAVDLITHYGQQMLTGTYTTPEEDPYPALAYNNPTKPGDLLQDCK